MGLGAWGLHFSRLRLGVTALSSGVEDFSLRLRLGNCVFVLFSAWVAVNELNLSY